MFVCVQFQCLCSNNTIYVTFQCLCVYNSNAYAVPIAYMYIFNSIVAPFLLNMHKICTIQLKNDNIYTVLTRMLMLRYQFYLGVAHRLQFFPSPLTVLTIIDQYHSIHTNTYSIITCNEYYIWQLHIIVLFIYIRIRMCMLILSFVWVRVFAE